MGQLLHPYRLRYVWLALALLLPALAAVAPLPGGLTREGLNSLGAFGMAVLLWVTSAVPLPVTGLLVLASIPTLGIMEPHRAFALFGNPSVFFILGAFVLAAALMGTGLSRRLSLFLLSKFGSSPRRLSTGILVTCALLSCVMPEHAVAAMVFPTVATIADALKLEPRRSRFALQLYLSMAWGCVTGGIATMLGGARVPLALGIFQEVTGRTIGFADWTLAAAPVALALAVTAAVVLQIAFPSEVREVHAVRELLQREVAASGPWNRREVKTAVVGVVTILGWVFLGERVGMATLALLSSFALFAVNAISWREVEEWVNWGVLLMYGGAIALGTVLTESGASAWLARSFLRGIPENPLLFLSAAAMCTLLLTEFISNAAAVAVMLPLALSAGVTLGVDQQLVLFAVAIPSGLTYTLPMGSPPNAIAFSSGYYEVGDVLVPGILMSLFSVAAFLLAAWLYWPSLASGLP